jgi:aspartoacylase
METTRWDKNCVSEVRNVVVVGATHGNELHGIHLVDEINSNSASLKLGKECPSLSIQAIIGNVAASVAVGTGAGLRYCETDLNRCFMMEDLANRDIRSIEGLRAKEIDALLGPKSSDSPITDLILDFHSTTSNTGILLLCHPRDKFSLRLIAHLQSIHPTISVSLWPDTEVALLPSIARSGMTVEVGPIPHSTSNTELYQRTKAVMYEAMIYTEMHNQWVRTGMPPAQLKPVKLLLYKRFATVGYPRDSSGTWHNNLIRNIFPIAHCIENLCSGFHTLDDENKLKTVYAVAHCSVSLIIKHRLNYRLDSQLFTRRSRIDGWNHDNVWIPYFPSDG